MLQQATAGERVQPSRHRLRQELLFLLFNQLGNSLQLELPPLPHLRVVLGRRHFGELLCRGRARLLHRHGSLEPTSDTT